MHTNEHPQNQLLETCVEHILEIIPMVRGNINAHLQSEVNRYEWITPGQARLLYHISQGATNITALSCGRKQAHLPSAARWTAWLKKD